MKNLFPALAFAILLSSCAGNSAENDTNKKTQSTIAQKTDSSQLDAKPADAATILSRKQVPVLCYHHIYDIPKATREYDVTVQAFREQMKMLADSGFKTITPDQYYDYLTKGTPLPEKPVMITYDDTDEEQFRIAKPEMDKYGFKGVYFIMTISIGRPRYMTKEQIKQLSDEGHVIASHTWDHHRVDKLKNENKIQYRGKDTVVNEWDFQLANTRKKLEEITGKPVHYFAYPFGIWSKEAIPEIEKRGYKMAFQLSTPRDSSQPLYTVRRMIVAPTWTAAGMLRVMKSTFK
jgi:peptidoglycan/xylan/chitin deacetylase (PgdA/CDA1 family)